MAKENTQHDVVYGKNASYSQEEITKLTKMYHMALDAGDMDTVQDAFSKIYSLTEKYVYKTLWDNYGWLMRDKTHREDVVQEIWTKIFTELKNYDPEKGAITTFMMPWIKHVVSNYTSKNFRRTSTYYANAIQRINWAQNYCRQYGLNANDTQVLVNLTGLSEATIKNTLDIMAKKETASYEKLVEIGMDCQSQSLKNPEDEAINLESERNLREILEETLTDEEMQILEYLLNPDNPSKDRSSYREIMMKMPDTNIPRIKRAVSKITTKLKNNKRFAECYPYIVKQEQALEENYLPIFADSSSNADDDDDLFDDLGNLGTKRISA